MIYIKNKLIPFGDYNAITIYPFVFFKKDLSKIDINHEEIHGKQQLELFVIFFYLIYLVEFIFKGYRNISFEKEAYGNEKKINYINNRKIFSMWRNNYG